MVTTVATPDDTPRLLRVRATVNLAGLRAGDDALVDPSQPYIRECLKGNFLVALPQAEQPGANDE